MLAGVLVGVLGVATAACSSGAPARQVATLPSDEASTGTGSGGTQTVSQSDQAFVDFARCLRSHGVNEPDPRQRPGDVGLSVDIPRPTAANRAALAACDHFMAKTFSDKEAGASRELAQWLPSLVRYAACMRSHDIDMLDPGPDGQLNLGDVPGITSDFGRYSPQFRAADAACRHLLPAGVRDDGTGP